MKLRKYLWEDDRRRLRLLRAAAIYSPLLFIVGIIMPLAAIILKRLEPVIKLRIGELRTDRIGHQAHDLDIYLRGRALRERSGRELHLLVADQPANRQLMTMIKRKVYVLEHPFFLLLFKLARKCASNSKIWIDIAYDLSRFQEFNRVPPRLAFTAEEKNKGQEVLLRMGIKPSDSFVCFIARDKTYLDTAYPWRSRGEWSYNDYRNSNIRNYLPAAEALASSGIFAVRMGYIVERPIETKNPRVIDYATRYRSDFGDVYLSGKCKFFLGDNSGLHCVAQAFGVPVAAANWIQIKYAMIGKQDIFIHKKFWSIKEKRFLTFREIKKAGMDSWFRTDQYAKAGIELVENSADEILALAKEMNARLDGSWITTDEDEELQQRYRDLFLPGDYSYGFPSRVGAEFLRRNRNLLD